MGQDFDADDLESFATGRESDRPRRSMAPIAIALAAVAGFGGIVYYAYSQGAKTAEVAGPAPLIQADATPMKIKPEDPGGAQVPHQDKLVLNGANTGPKIENVLPPAEAPLPKPAQTPPELFRRSQEQAAQAAIAAVSPQPAPAPAKSGAKPAVAPTQTAQAQPAPSAKPGTAPTQLAAPQPHVLTPPTPMGRNATTPGAQQTVSTAGMSATTTQLAMLPPPSKPVPPPAVAAPVAPAVVGGSGKGYRIQLASVRTQESAEGEWTKLKKAHPELNGLSMTPVRVDLGEKGVFWRIQANVSDGATASKMCSDISARSQHCMVVKPSAP